jgi:hypothetical protein
MHIYIYIYIYICSMSCFGSSEVPISQPFSQVPKTINNRVSLVVHACNFIYEEGLGRKIAV